jgi:hypothetical protein
MMTLSCMVVFALRLARDRALAQGWLVGFWLLAPGYWTAGATLLSSRLDSRDLIGSKNLLHLLRDGSTRALDLANPSLIQGSHRQHTALQLHRCGARERLPYGELPGEVRPLFRRWLSPDDFSKDAG